MPTLPSPIFNVGSYLAAGQPIATAIAEAIADANGLQGGVGGGVVVIPAGAPAGGSITGLAPGTTVIDFRAGTQTVYAQSLTGAGHPWIVAAVNLTGQTVAIGSTPLLTAAQVLSTGIYRATLGLIMTTAATAGTINTTYNYNNGVTSISKSGTALAATSLGSEVEDVFTGFVAAGQAITYTTVFTSVTGSPAYAARFRLEYLG